MFLYAEDLTNKILFKYELINQSFSDDILSQIIKNQIKEHYLQNDLNFSVDLNNVKHIVSPEAIVESNYLVVVFLGQNNTIKSIKRTKATGEVFTPRVLVLEMLKKLSEQQDIIVLNSEKTYLDNSCGNSAFLAEILKHGVPIHNIYGVDLMADNVADSVARLAVLEHYGIDIVDENAVFKINHPVYADNHDHNWLLDNYKGYSRTYSGVLDGIEIDITVSFEYFDAGNGGVFRYTFKDGTTGVNPNIVCQDALKYNYCFEGRKKNIVQF